MARAELKKGDSQCNHSFTRQDKKHFHILTRVCTKCAQEELVCDEPTIDELTMRKLVKKE